MLVKAKHGTVLDCKGWQQEAALRMLMNNLDPEVAEKPDELIVYGGRGKAARNWDCFNAIVDSLKQLEGDETLLIQSGKPVGVFQSFDHAPRVLIANSNLVPNWATWDVFDDLERRGLMMFGQMTAGSWIYIGSQGIVQGTYETFVEAGRRHFNSDLKGRVILTAGLGGMGGAQPLAGVFAGATVLAVEVDRHRAEKRLATGYLDEIAPDLESARILVEKYREQKLARSVGVIANMADAIHELLAVGFQPDIVTDQTSAHDPLLGYIPSGLSLRAAHELRERDARSYVDLAKQSMGRHVQGMLEFQRRGSIVFDYGNNIRAMAKDVGVADAFNIPGFVPEYVRPLFCRGSGPFRFVALSGDPADIRVLDQALLELFPNKAHLHTWIEHASQRIHFQGLPARICWLEYGERAKAGVRFNELVRLGRVSAPIVIGRDHLDCGSVASPNRETEAMLDGSDMVSDWPLLNAMSNVACGATWVSLHHGGGVGMGYSQHAGQVIVADGTEAASLRLQRVLTVDPGFGLFRHVDAGYEDAIHFARAKDVKIPMRPAAAPARGFEK